MAGQDQFTVRTARTLADVKVIREWIEARRKAALMDESIEVTVADVCRRALRYLADAIRSGSVDVKEVAT